ncbi:MAG: DNA polymerase III subunit alpha [Nitrospirae bacterium]|nr:DNA polymerase III subunit alpha [Nitrospirota bacterium]MBI3351926.1 DNA polymerase III subunit alpha [Nitrospirota bacterium]
MTTPFIHLHVHTMYSLLEASIQIDALIKQAVEYQMPAVAITDYGNLFGAVEFYLTAQKKGIKPIIGCELFVAPKSRLIKDNGGLTTPFYHLVLLAEDQTGYQNLLKLVSLAHVEGFYYRPRIDLELLSRNSDGLIALSGSLKGEIPYLLERGQVENATRAAAEYQRIFGNDRFYLELCDNNLPEQKKVNPELIKLSQKLSLPLIATNDCHYLKEEDALSLEILHCLSSGRTLNQKDHLGIQTNQLCFKSSEEMESLFKEVPEALSNTFLIAERCAGKVKLTSGKTYLPQYEVPEAYTRESYLNELARNGLQERLKKVDPSQHPLYQKRLEDELAMLGKMGYSGYFLIVWDIINYARTHQIPVGPGRGSAAGSLVAYSLKITDIDPIIYGLIFERFLNPERVSLPDIDMDFCVNGREEVIQYVVNKYGADHVAQIITFGTMAAKGAIRDVGRVLDIPYAEVDKVAKLVPNELNITLEKALEVEPKIKELMASDPKILELMTRAQSMEGLARHASTHAAGIVISDKPLIEHVPLYRGTHDEIVTQFSMGDIEKIGLVKFDFLGLRTLTVIREAEKIIQRNHPLDISAISMDDSATFSLLCKGNTSGIFQLESRGMVDLLIKMHPERFEDLIALLALYRPGPIQSGMLDDFIKRKRGKTKIVYEHPLLEDILKETYGVIVYQEQVMKIANVLAGFSLGEADLLRRAMGKKLPEEMEKQKTIFIEGAKKNKIPEKKGEKIFDLMAYFAGYGFNKSHSAAYALVTYQTAYLKAHFPIPFMAALLSSEMGNPDKIVQYLSECKSMGIRILAPNVNQSEHDFTISDEGVRFGLAAVKNVGSAAIEAIISNRKTEGPFHSLFELCKRVDLRKVNKRVFEGLIKGGALSDLSGNRAQQMAFLEKAMEEGNLYQKEEEVGQERLFGSLGMVNNTGLDQKEDPFTNSTSPDIPEWDEVTLLKMEKESLGFYISSHPLARFESDLKRYFLADSITIEEREDGAEVRIAGLISSKKVTRTKKGDPMAYLKIEDLVGTIEGIVFPELYRSSSHFLDMEHPLIFSGTVDKGEKGLKLKLTKIEKLQTLPRKHPQIEISMDTDVKDEEDINALRNVLIKYPGEAPVYLRLVTPEKKEYYILLSSSYTLMVTESLMDELFQLFGRENVQVTYKQEIS